MKNLLFAVLLTPNFLLAQVNLSVLGHKSYPAPISLSGCAHHVDSSGTEYALVGASNGLDIVDISDPANPVSKFMVPGPNSNWREVKTWKGFAFVGSEATWSGITIVDLRSLPDTVYWKVWYGDAAHDSTIISSHTVQAQDDYLYIFGAAILNKGAIICDITDPWNPQIQGIYGNQYVHDGFIRGDTLWTSEVYVGQFGVVDISDKSNPQLLATQGTPAAFNHNSGLSPDSQILFTTDEKANAPLAAYDVSDLNNITLLDKYRPSQKPTFEVHNVRVFGRYLVNPSYGGQLTIVDAARPDNLIETAWISLGSSLVWDADPYLPSGNIVATAKNEGLYILKPTYQPACWLEGTVTDAVTGNPLAGVSVNINATSNSDTTVFSGGYKTGAITSGPYLVNFVKDGYAPQAIANVQLNAGLVQTLDVQLQPLPSAVNDIPGIQVDVHPNPFLQQINITLSGESNLNDAEIRLLDATGKTVRRQTINGNTLQIDGLAQLSPGAYDLLITRQSTVLYRCHLVHTH